MGESDQSTTMAIVDRLGRLEGLLVGLQSSISQSQAQWAGSQARVERLEQRLVELETRQVTRDDLKSLADKVDTLVAADARQSGGRSAVSWSVSNLATWLALAVSVLALVGVGANREAIQQRNEQPLPPVTK
jgi:hypothetical protein